MDAETERYFDDGEPGDWLLVDYWTGMGMAVLEGEFGGWGRSQRGVWFMHVRGVMLLPTMDIRKITVLSHAGCL